MDEDVVWQDIADMDTVLHKIPQKHFGFEENNVELPVKITFASGEGQMPISVFEDEHAEYLAFPTIFCGQCRPDNKDTHIPVHYSDT